MDNKQLAILTAKISASVIDAVRESKRRHKRRRELESLRRRAGMYATGWASYTAAPKHHRDAPRTKITR